MAELENVVVLSVVQEHLLRLARNQLFLPISPPPGRKGITFSPTNNFSPQIVATQREERQKDAPYELRSLKMFTLTWGQGTGSCTPVCTVGQRTDQGVQQENNQGHGIRRKSRR